MALLEADLLAVGVLVGEILEPDALLEVDVAHLDVLVAGHEKDGLLLGGLGGQLGVEPVLDTRDVDERDAVLVALRQ